MHGPCGPQMHFCPEYGRQSGVIWVTDDVLETISRVRFRKRRRWRRARDAGLALWEQTGLRFAVEVGPGARHTYFDPENPLDTYVTPFIIPGRIRLIRDATPPGGRTNYATYYNGGAVAAFDLEKPVTDPIYEWHRVVCHEVGHCLGLDHGNAGGIMQGGLAPDAHDLASVKTYFGV